jgi:hypothetical protein
VTGGERCDLRREVLNDADYNGWTDEREVRAPFRRAVADGQAAVGLARKDLDDTVAVPHYDTSIPGTPSFAPPKVGLRRPS